MNVHSQTWLHSWSPYAYSSCVPCNSTSHAAQNEDISCFIFPVIHVIALLTKSHSLEYCSTRDLLKCSQDIKEVDITQKAFQITKKRGSEKHKERGSLHSFKAYFLINCFFFVIFVYKTMPHMATWLWLFWSSANLEHQIYQTYMNPYA